MTDNSETCSNTYVFQVKIYTSPKFLTHQHGSPEIELVEELRDEDVYLEHVGDVLALHVAQHVDEPLEVLVRRTYPEEVYLVNYKRRM